MGAGAWSWGDSTKRFSKQASDFNPGQCHTSDTQCVCVVGSSVPKGTEGREGESLAHFLPNTREAASAIAVWTSRLWEKWRRERKRSRRKRRREEQG